MYIALMQSVALVFEIDERQLAAATRGKAPIARARQVAMYIAHIAWRLTLTDVGRLFGRDRTTVAHACEAVEDLRDDPLFDRRLDLLERAIRALVEPSLMPGRMPC
jgi:chromosomal replication initiation ATPase DnaA